MRARRLGSLFHAPADPPRSSTRRPSSWSRYLSNRGRWSSACSQHSRSPEAAEPWKGRTPRDHRRTPRDHRRTPPDHRRTPPDHRRARRIIVERAGSSSNAAGSSLAWLEALGREAALRLGCRMRRIRTEARCADREPATPRNRRSRRSNGERTVSRNHSASLVPAQWTDVSS
jgi:hypothetical protein